MTTSVNKVVFVQEDLVKTLGISKRHSERALVSMSKLIKIGREVVSLNNTSTVIYNNLWVDLVNKWSSISKVELIFTHDVDLVNLFELNEDIKGNLLENSIIYSSNQFLLGTKNNQEGKYITVTGKKKHKDYFVIFDSDSIREVIVHLKDGGSISVTTLIESYIEELKSL